MKVFVIVLFETVVERQAVVNFLGCTSKTSQMMMLYAMPETLTQQIK
jgi:hypothetical protein